MTQFNHGDKIIHLGDHGFSAATFLCYLPERLGDIDAVVQWPDATVGRVSSASFGLVPPEPLTAADVGLQETYWVRWTGGSLGAYCFSEESARQAAIPGVVTHLVELTVTKVVPL